MKVDILAIGVHPDDVEMCIAGTLMKEIDNGKKVAIVDLTRGELGTRGDAETREEEAREASKIMGVKHRENVMLADGFFQNDSDSKKRIIPFIRKYQPEIVITNAYYDRHPDHGRASKLVSEACFLSGLLKVKTYDEFGKPQSHWRPKVVYHFIQDRFMVPDVVVDITDYIDRKMDAIAAYKTQVYDPNATGPDSPISSREFWKFLKASDRVMGRYLQVEFGEGFRVERPVGAKSLFDVY